MLPSEKCLRTLSQRVIAQIPVPSHGSAHPCAQPRTAQSTELGGRDTRALVLSPALSWQCHGWAWAGSGAGSKQGHGDRAVPAPQCFQPGKDTVLSAVPAALPQPPCIPRDSCCQQSWGQVRDTRVAPATLCGSPRGHGAVWDHSGQNLPLPVSKSHQCQWFWGSEAGSWRPVPGGTETWSTEVLPPSCLS